MVHGRANQKIKENLGKRTGYDEQIKMWVLSFVELYISTKSTAVSLSKQLDYKALWSLLKFSIYFHYQLLWYSHDVYNTSNITEWIGNCIAKELSPQNKYI